MKSYKQLISEISSQAKEKYIDKAPSAKDKERPIQNCHETVDTVSKVLDKKTYESFDGLDEGYAPPGVKVVGEFREKDHGKIFHYSKTEPNSWGAKHGFPHEIHMFDGHKRFAHVKGTVAHVITDEDEHGKPVVDKWNIKQHKKYTNEEVVVGATMATNSNEVPKKRSYSEFTKKIQKEEYIEESHEELDKHISVFSKGIKSSKAQHSTYKNGGGKINNMKHVSTDASHQDIFNHLKKMGYKKTSGYDPKPNQFDMHYNHDSMTTRSDGIHHPSGVSAHVEQEHGGPTKVHFTHRNIKEVLEPSMGAGEYIKDFQKSDAPQFKGKSQEKRRIMGIAAYMAAKREQTK